MAQDPRFGQIDLDGVSDDTPVVVLVGTDPAVPGTLREYKRELVRKGADKDVADRVEAQRHYIEGYQSFNTELVGLPQ